MDASARGGDFYIATSGDLHVATRGDFLMATDNLATHTGVLRVRSDGRAERVADRFQDIATSRTRTRGRPDVDEPRLGEAVAPRVPQLTGRP